MGTFLLLTQMIAVRYTGSCYCICDVPPLGYGPGGQEGNMKLQVAASIAALILAAIVVAAQDNTAVQVAEPVPFHAGGPVAFIVKLNEPLPKGAHFDFRISPVSADEEIALGSGEPINGSDKEFRVSGALPEAAIPGEWHIKVIWLFLPGAGWTSNTISPNDLRFQVGGKSYPIPTKADVTLAR